MSASEKLKALLAGAESAERGWDNDIHGEPLLAALPQIVAVVEAAEEHQAAARARWTNLKNEGELMTLREYHQTAAALSALEEALK